MGRPKRLFGVFMVSAQTMLWRRVPQNSQVKNWKSRSHGVSNILPCPIRGSVPIWPICFICGTNITYERRMYHALFPGQTVKSSGHIGPSKFWPCRPRGYVPRWYRLICGTNSTHEGAMCRVIKVCLPIYVNVANLKLSGISTKLEWTVFYQCDNSGYWDWTCILSISPQPCSNEV